MTTPLERVTHYLKTTGWIEPVDPGAVGGLWRHPQSELLLPVPNELVDDGIDWHRIAERLAMVERAEISDVLARLSGRTVDVANLRAANDIIIFDTIPYLAAVTLVRESWVMLRSSATTSLGPRPFIRRYRTSGDEIIAEARMAHTRRGSFVIPLQLPLPEFDQNVESVEPTFDGLIHVTPEPPQRRVMRTFAESLAAINTVAVEPEGEPSLDGIHDLIRAGVSHQFASALHRVLAEDAVAEFSASFQWASNAGPPPRVDNAVEIPAAARSRIQNVAARLKATTPARTEEFTGPIIRIERHPNAETGTVTIQGVRSGHPAHVNVNVSPKRLDEAWIWARSRETVYVRSKLPSVTWRKIPATRPGMRCGFTAMLTA